MISLLFSSTIPDVPLIIKKWEATFVESEESDLLFCLAENHQQHDDKQVNVGYPFMGVRLFQLNEKSYCWRVITPAFYKQKLRKNANLKGEKR